MTLHRYHVGSFPAPPATIDVILEWTSDPELPRRGVILTGMVNDMLIQPHVRLTAELMTAGGILETRIVIENSQPFRVRWATPRGHAGHVAVLYYQPHMLQLVVASVHIPSSLI